MFCILRPKPKLQSKSSSFSKDFYIVASAYPSVYCRIAVVEAEAALF